MNNKMPTFLKIVVDKIFGKFNPRALELNLFELFGPTKSHRKMGKYMNRGSSAIWNDDKEFLTPTPNCAGKQHKLGLDT